MSDLDNFLLPNEATCIVACSADSARFWVTESRFGEWKAIAEMHDEDAGKRESEVVSDRPGRSFDITGSGRHAMSQKTTVRQHTQMQFARKVANYLNRAIANSDVTKLVILSAPGFLGHLRTELSDAALRAIAVSAPLNLGDLDEGRIRRYFE